MPYPELMRKQRTIDNIDQKARELTEGQPLHALLYFPPSLMVSPPA
ncbi:MAG: hypothetical protein PHF31_17550 [Methylobacter sp.]|nr:hypothetical protein [Methylobacter sp.]